MRIAVISGPAPGHAFPAAALARAIRTAGHDVWMLCGPDWDDGLRRDGIGTVTLPFLETDDDRGDFGHRLHDRAAQMARPTGDMLHDLGVDGVVADALTVCGGLAAEIVDVPWVELVPHPIADLSRDLPPSGTALPPGRTPLGRARDGLLRSLTARSLRQAEEQRSEVRARIGLPPRRVRPVRRLVATLPALEPPRSDWPADAVLVGPLHWDSTDVDLAPPPGPGPLVVVSESTSNLDRGGLVACALGLREVRLAVTTLGPYGGEPLLATAVAGPGRQGPLLAQASVVVSGAGNGIICKSLAAGVPLVVVPGPGDQKENAARLVRTGAAIAIRPDRLTPERLSAAVHDILGDPDYRLAAQAAGATGSGLSPSYAASTAVAALASSKASALARSPA
jgi:UDP:flavonoid glycosyltransferase YjiC (YdhE family)